MFSAQYSYAHLASKASSRSGFSLIETLAAFSIIGIIITVAIPQFRSHTAGLTLRHEAAALQSFLELSAAYALTSRTTVEISASPTNLSATHSNGTIFAMHRVQHGASLNLASSSSPPFYFYPTISASPATLVLTNNFRRCSVIISLRGRVRTAC